MTRPLMGFPGETFANRRARARDVMAGGAMILASAPILKRSRDTEHRYRPDSELFFLTGAVEPGMVALVRESENEAFVLFVPTRDPKAEAWFGPRLGPEEAKEVFGADAVYPLEDLGELLPPLLRPHDRVFFRLGIHPDLERWVLEALRWARGPGSRAGTGPRSVVDPGEVLGHLRLVKDGDEISHIRKATALTVAGFRETIGLTRPGMGEWEVEACLESAFRRGGAQGPAFPTIVGSGKNGCVLHYVDNQEVIEDGQLVLLDGGAELDLYSGDVTRTYPSGGRYSDRQLEVYGIVQRAYDLAIAQIRPGVPVARVHDAALKELVRGLADLGALTGEVENLIEEKAYESFFPHQTSHWLGLDVHDAGDYASRGDPRELEPGMVLTVEPGLYFTPGFGSPALPYSGIGVRIEDDFLVTEDGSENLTGALPVSPQALEALVGEGFRG